MSIQERLLAEVKKINILFNEYVKLAESEAAALLHASRLLEGPEGLLAFGWKRSFDSFVSSSSIAAVAAMDLEEFSHACAALQRAQVSLIRLCAYEEARIKKEAAVKAALDEDKRKVLAAVFG